MPELHWQKSSFSEDQANCLYVATAPDGTVRLRESDDEPDITLTATPTQLAALIARFRTEDAQRAHPIG
ncbi:DUF397 domain-containing protein [Streptomyces sp. NPDC002994]|uniref:DUF397 domain-containing protein n=1 Tax=Streptomyces sp. NPDC002994 TaxID=3154441 RepID=UPI0033AD73F7